LAEPYILVAMASPLPLHCVGMCQQSSWHKDSYTCKSTYMCVCGWLGYEWIDWLLGINWVCNSCRPLWCTVCTKMKGKC